MDRHWKSLERTKFGSGGTAGVGATDAGGTGLENCLEDNHGAQSCCRYYRTLEADALVTAALFLRWAGKVRALRLNS